MAVQSLIKNATPAQIWSAIKAEITNGKIKTWEYDANSQTITHNTKGEQWKDKAFFSVSIPRTDQLRFELLPPRGQRTVPRVVYAIYHGRLTEMLVEHFNDYLDWTASYSQQ
jgi:hypothetical protein